MVTPLADQRLVSASETISLTTLPGRHLMLAVAIATAIVVLLAPPGWTFASQSILQICLPLAVLLLAGAYADRLRRSHREAMHSHARAVAAHHTTIATLERSVRAASDTERQLEVMIAEQVQEIARVRRAVEAEAFERRRAEELLRRVAHQDSLTGLPNRALLRDRFVIAASNARRNGTRTGVLVVDIDGFRAINESHGTAIGDQVLVIVAGLLHGRLREADTVARTGGDEFVVLVSDLPSAHEAALMAERILALLSAPMQVGDALTLHLTASVGIAVLGTDGDDIDALLGSAAVALGHARFAGRNAWRYHSVPVDTMIPSVSSILRARRDAAAPTP